MFNLEKIMWHAINMAKDAQAINEVPVGAVITNNEKIISFGMNRMITDNDPSAHAEIVAIRSAAKILKNYRLSNCTIYVTLEPCIMCMGAIFHARIKLLVYGASDKKTGGYVNLNQFNHHTKIIGGVLSHESSKILKEFFLTRR